MEIILWNKGHLVIFEQYRMFSEFLYALFSKGEQKGYSLM